MISSAEYDKFDLELDLHNLGRMLHAALFIQAQGEGDEDVESGHLLLELAGRMAEDVNEKFQANMIRICK